MAEEVEIFKQEEKLAPEDQENAVLEVAHKKEEMQSADTSNEIVSAEVRKISRKSLKIPEDAEKGRTPLEQAKFIQGFLDNGYSRTKIASFYGMTLSWLPLRLALLELNPKVQEMLDEKLPLHLRLKLSIASNLADIKDRDEQLIAANCIIKEQMSAVRARNYICKRKNEIGQRDKVKEKSSPNEDCRKLVALVKRIKDALDCSAQELEPYTKMNCETMWELFRNRPDNDRVTALDEIESVQALMKELKQLLIWM